MDQVVVDVPEPRNALMKSGSGTRGHRIHNLVTVSPGQILLVPFGYYITPSVQRAEVSNVAPSERSYSHLP